MSLWLLPFQTCIWHVSLIKLTHVFTQAYTCVFTKIASIVKIIQNKLENSQLEKVIVGWVTTSCKENIVVWGN
jgi:hypothetical protein